jgi:hypothetical protein
MKRYVNCSKSNYEESQTMTNTEAENLISRNKSVFKYDTEMTEALNLAIKALEFIDENCPKTFVDYLNGIKI